MNNYSRQSYRSCTRNGATKLVSLRSGDLPGTTEDLSAIRPTASSNSSDVVWSGIQHKLKDTLKKDALKEDDLPLTF
jgi:hypothetical protein